MDSRIARELRLRYHPVAVIFSDEKPEGALQFKGDRWGCVVSMLTAAAKGRTACFDRETCGCTGGQAGLAFGSSYDKFPGGIEYFLSTGAGEGYREGEAYKKTPELARRFVEELPVTDIPYTYVIFKPLEQVEEKDEVQLVVFYATADQLSGLVVLANYDRPEIENVMVPFGAGCQTICLMPYQEAQRATPRAVMGLLDVSARPFVDPDILAFTVPFAMFKEMEANVSGSFLEKEAWAKVKERIPEPNG